MLDMAEKGVLDSSQRLIETPYDNRTIPLSAIGRTGSFDYFESGICLPNRTLRELVTELFASPDKERITGFSSGDGTMQFSLHPEAFHKDLEIAWAKRYQSDRIPPLDREVRGILFHIMKDPKSPQGVDFLLCDSIGDLRAMKSVARQMINACPPPLLSGECLAESKRVLPNIDCYQFTGALTDLKKVFNI